MNTTKIERLESPIGTIEVAIEDAGKKQNLLLIHGFNDTKETFVFLKGTLLNRFNLISFDFPGHGGSEWKKDGMYSLQDNLVALHSVVNTYLPEQFFILAHSMGAGIASRFTGLFPQSVKGLILFEGFSGLQPEKREAERIKNWLIGLSKKKPKREENSSRRPMSLEEATSKLSIVYQGLSKEKISLLALGLIRSVPPNMYVWKNDPRLKLGNPIPFPPKLSRYLWKEISCKTLMIYGMKTHLMPENMEEIKSHFNFLEYAEIENSSHNMHHDNPEKVLELITNFLDKNFHSEFLS
ncbi:MAG: alpha/beta hydrolase [Leptospiraceae bacterium]|nr:alpha/beta hydrolase [Leptospiraceae bacterium]